MRPSRRRIDDDNDFDTSDLRSQPGLASIFEQSTSPARSHVSNHNVQKQPTATSSVIIAKTVQCFKMVDKAYQSQGRVGAALVSVHFQVGTYCQLLLYRDKQNHLCNIKILKGFKYHVQPKNYCTFYDNENNVWSILFDKKADMIEFNIQVAAIRWKAEGSSALLQQDLWCPANDVTTSSVAVGDVVELAYSLVPFQNVSKVPGDLSNKIEVAVENSRWKQYLNGLQSESEKVIIAQPSMMEELITLEKEPHSSTCVMRLSVIKINKSQNKLNEIDSLDKGQSSSLQDLAQARSEPSLVQKPVEDVRSSPQSTKANLISRMAKMGQPLPFKTVAPIPSDSDDTENDLSRLSRSNHVHSKARPRAQHSSTVFSDVIDTIAAVTVSVPVNQPPVPPIQWAPTPFMNDRSRSNRSSHVHPKARPRAQDSTTVSSDVVDTIANATVSVPVAQPPVPMQWPPTSFMTGNMYPANAQLQSPLESQAQFNVFFSEVRTTNSELRMGITRLTDKVESLQSKMDNSDKGPNPEISSALERLLDNEQQLKCQLQQIMTTLNRSPPSSQNIPSGDQAAAGPCHRCTQLEKMQETIRKLETENEYLQTNNSAQRDALFNAKVADKDQLSRIEELQKQLAQEQVGLSELNQNIQELETYKSKMEEETKVGNNLIKELQSTIYEKQRSIDKLESALKASEATKLEEVRRNLQEVIVSKTDVADHVKQVMNSVFKCVKVQFEPHKSYDTSTVQSILATTIKAVTVQYLASLSDSGNPLAESQSSSTLHSHQDYSSEQSNGLEAMPSTQSGLSTFSEADDSSQENLITSLVDNHVTTENSHQESASTNHSRDHGGNSTDDVLQVRPPPPPLFEEDDENNEDDWLAL